MSFLPSYSQSPILTDFTHPLPLSKSVLKLVCNVNIVYETPNLFMPRNLRNCNVQEFGFSTSSPDKGLARGDAVLLLHEQPNIINPLLTVYEAPHPMHLTREMKPSKINSKYNL